MPLLNPDKRLRDCRPFFQSVAAYYEYRSSVRDVNIDCCYVKTAFGLFTCNIYFLGFEDTGCSNLEFYTAF
jgi:hypothetical protein